MYVCIFEDLAICATIICLQWPCTAIHWWLVKHTHPHFLPAALDNEESPPDKRGRETEEEGEGEEEEEDQGSSSLTQLLHRLGLVQPGAAEGETPQKLLVDFSLQGIADLIRKIQTSEHSEEHRNETLSATVAQCNC